MPRNQLEHSKLKLIGGINQQDEDASLDQCADCLNVWAPRGRLETRPGYRGVANYPSGFASTSGITFFVEGEDVSAGTFTGVTLDNLEALDQDAAVVSDRWYVGYPTKLTSFAIHVAVAASNSNNTKFRAEYYNGTNWVHLDVREQDEVYTDVETHLGSLSSATHAFTFVQPQDWATTTVDGQSAFWLRFVLLVADFDNLVNPTATNAVNAIYTPGKIRGLFAVQFPFSKKYVVLLNNSFPATGSIYLDVFASDAIYFKNPVVFTAGSTSSTSTLGVDADIPATIAVVPEFNECYLAYNHAVTLYELDDAGEGTNKYTNLNTRFAKVEDRDFAVGPGAPFDRNYIAQEASWPEAKFTAFFDNRLWCSGINSDPFKIQWSAAAPFHRVWPSLSFEQLMEDDNSPITAMKALGEQMVVYKQDSIWLMIDSGLDAFGLRRFVPKRVVAGVGCVAHNSVQQIRGNHIFLAEDGVYAFDGTPNIRKVTKDPNTGADRLAETIKTITASRRPFAAAAHWRTEQMYLLSFSTKGQATTNDTTIAWDYDHDTWWIWDNIDAQHWMSDEGVNNDETLYFGDSAGNVHRFNIGRTDHGAAISASATSHRMHYESEMTRRARQVSIISSNKTASLSCEVLADDEPTGSSGTFNFNDFNEANIIPRRRRKRLDYRKDGEWFQTKLTHSTKNERMYVSLVDVGYHRLGIRR
jgi:hypothetical protein